VNVVTKETKDLLENFWDITQRRVGNPLPTFRDKVSVPSSRAKKNNYKLFFLGLLDP
jgi:hypothetical protein